MSQPKCGLGDILRYDHGPTALMRVETVSFGHDGRGHRYYGRQFFGGTMGAYEFECLLASPYDIDKWNEENSLRLESFGGKL